MSTTIIIITLMMVWNDPLNLSFSCLSFTKQVQFEESSYFVRGHQADCSVFVFSLWAPTLGYAWVCLASVQQEPTGGLPLPGRGSEVGSKVTKSISCELLRASSVVTHRGSQARRDALPPPFFCFLPSFPCVGFLFAPSHGNTPILACSHTLYVLYDAHT